MQYLKDIKHIKESCVIRKNKIAQFKDSKQFSQGQYYFRVIEYH